MILRTLETMEAALEEFRIFPSTTALQRPSYP